MAKEDNLQFYALARKVRHDNAALIAAGVTINELLKAIYQEETGQTDFRTLKEWNKDGQRVKKGEKCFRLFSRPANTIKEEKGQQPGEEDSSRFFVVKLFHAGQVQPATKKETI